MAKKEYCGRPKACSNVPHEGACKKARKNGAHSCRDYPYNKGNPSVGKRT